MSERGGDVTHWLKSTLDETRGKVRRLLIIPKCRRGAETLGPQHPTSHAQTVKMNMCAAVCGIDEQSKPCFSSRVLGALMLCKHAAFFTLSLSLYIFLLSRCQGASLDRWLVTLKQIFSHRLCGIQWEFSLIRLFFLVDHFHGKNFRPNQRENAHQLPLEWNTRKCERR